MIYYILSHTSDLNLRNIVEPINVGDRIKLLWLQLGTYLYLKIFWNVDSISYLYNIVKLTATEDIYSNKKRDIDMVGELWNSIANTNSAYLILYKISPLGNILTYTFGTMISCFRASFSLRKKVSGIQTLVGSVSVRYFNRPVIRWNIF